MNKLKEIERLEKGEQRLWLYSTLVIFPLAVISFAGPPLIGLHTDMKDIPFWLSVLFVLPVAVAGAFFGRKSLKNSKRSVELRKEWLEEVGLPKDADFFYPLHSIAEGESCTFTHPAGDEVIVYRVAKRNGEFIVSSGVVELAEVKPKVAERSFVEESENDELWKLINSNSPTVED